MSEVKVIPVEVVDIDTLTPDPENTRKRTPRNVEAIKASLERFGQVKPIVVDADGIVRAGNGTLRAAQELGWTQIAITRKPFSGSEAVAFSIADNRSAELAEWEFETLAGALRALRDEGNDIMTLGWQDYEIAPLLEAKWTPVPPDDQVFMPRNGDGDASGERVAGITLTADQRMVFERARDKMREQEEDDEMTEGRVVELIAADYLAGS